MITVTIQPNPFKQEKFVRQYDVGQSIAEIYDAQNMDVCIASCLIFINDISIIDYTLIPNRWGYCSYKSVA